MLLLIHQGNAQSRPASLVSFASHVREAYSGLALTIVASEKNKPGTIKIIATSPGLKSGSVEIKSKQDQETVK